MAITQRHDMPTQDPEVRITNFDEVALGYTDELALEEAKRCLNCKNPQCMQGCPVGIHIPDFINKVKDGDLDSAARILTGDSNLAVICGRVCPQELQCEGKCVLGRNPKLGGPVAIGRLERYVADYALKKNIKTEKKAPIGKRVAVVGSGPAGLSCAAELTNNGVEVTVFEALHKAGGVLTYGIPEFRLPKDIVQHNVDKLVENGVDIQTNVVVGKTILVQELLEEYDAVFIGSGAGLPMFMNIEGENFNGVYSANEYLTRINLMKAYKEDAITPILHGKRVVVIGGGNVAADAVRSSRRLGAHSIIVYRRGREEMPARLEEVEHAEQEGVEFQLLTNPVRILGDENGFVKGIECVRMELGEPDASGRRRPVPIEGSNFVIDCDEVIVSLGTKANPIIKSSFPELEVTKWGSIVADENGATPIKGLYAGGDAQTGAATVILAMGAGKKAAQDMLAKFANGEL